MSQGDERKRSVDEASKALDEVKTGMRIQSWEKSGRRPISCPGGLRRIDGVNLTSGTDMERVNLRLDEKGERQVADPQGREYQCEQRGGLGRSS